MAIKINNESLRARNSIEFRVIFATTFAVFLVGALVSRLLPWHWQVGRAETARRISVIAEAKAAANVFVPIAFMG